MPTRTIDVRNGWPLFDIASYGRRGPGRGDRLSQAQIEQISRTARRTPEVMLKVLTRGTQDLGAVERHFDYISRRGVLELETDEEGHLKGEGIGKGLLEDWDLDLDTHRRRFDLSAANGRKPPKLVHKLMFSMPGGTPPRKVLAAVRTFSREQFALTHRYAMVLHTDEPHPHVHMVVKAVSEQGVRIHIRKATLREWRRDFARHLREQGVAANATDRVVRGESKTHKRDSIYRAEQRGRSTYTRRREEAVARELLQGELRMERGKSQMLRNRKLIEAGWQAVCAMLLREGQSELAAEARRFVEEMPTPQTEKERIAGMFKLRQQPTLAHERASTR